MPFPEMQHFSGFLKKLSGPRCRDSFLRLGLGLSVMGRNCQRRPVAGARHERGRPTAARQEVVPAMASRGKTSTSTPLAK